MDSHNDAKLRQLTNVEIFYDLLHKHGGSILSVSFLINTQIDLFKNKIIIQNAINYWKDLHPLLKCNIRKLNDDKYYYTYASKDKINSNDNVSYIYYVKENQEQESNDYWKYIFENELSRPFNSSSELLWRLIFIKTDDRSSSISNLKSNYCLIFTIHHVITDGINAYSIILELFSIIEKLYHNKEIILDDYNVSNSIYEYDYPNDPRIVHVDNCELGFDIKYVKAPECLKYLMENDKNSSVLQKGSFYNIDGSKYTSIQSIIDNRSNNLTAIKFNVLQPEITFMLLDKCRRHNAKLTSCLNVIIAIALRQVIRLLKGSVFDERDETLTSFININMRPFLEPKLNNSVMGLWAAGLAVGFDKETDESYEKSDFWTNKFWQRVENESHKLHEYLKSKTFLTKELNETREKIFLKFISENIEVERNSFLESYSLANLGLSTSIQQDHSLNMINMVESYEATSFHKYAIYKYASFSTITINNYLFWTIFYNRKFVSNTVMDYWIETINDIILNKLQ